MTTEPQPTPTPTISPSLSSFLTPEEIAAGRAALEAGAAGKPKKPPKSGVFTRTYVSNNIPKDSTIKDNINKVFQRYYGRDASETEFTTYLPMLQNKYKSKSGASKSIVKETFKNGLLTATEYLTADNEDPLVFLETTIKGQLAKGVQEINDLNIPEGPSGKFFVQIKNLAFDNGIKLADNVATSYANKIVEGRLDEDTVYNTIRESAASAFPALADKIKAGIDLKDLASPYVQSMSDILEIPNTAIDLFDPQIRSAMAYTLPDGKIGTKSIYNFEKELRKDDRWQYTNKAREQAASVATTVLRDFGFIG